MSSNYSDVFTVPAVESPNAGICCSLYASKFLKYLVYLCIPFQGCSGKAIN
jgi:hypothetical protein